MGIKNKFNKLFNLIPQFIKRRQLNSDSKKSFNLLNKKLENFSQIDSYFKKFESLIESDYHEYIKTISTEKMAISLESSAFLAAFSKIKEPKKILDLGSGFSSFVLNNFTDSEVISIDDNADWLEKTRQYLLKKEIKDFKLELWDNFNTNVEFDLIFHDLGSMQTRMSELAKVLSFSKVGGFTFLDDVHKEEYNIFISNLDSKKYEQYNLFYLTSDKFDRYMIGVERLF